MLRHNNQKPQSKGNGKALVKSFKVCIIYFFNQFRINFQTRVLISLKKTQKINRTFDPLYLLQEKIVKTLS